MSDARATAGRVDVARGDDALLAWRLVRPAFEVHVPHDLILELRNEDLPADWRARPVSTGARAVGDAWLSQRASVALTVPSVLVPQERNLLLDPAHPRFAVVRIGAPKPFRFDERL